MGNLTCMDIFVTEDNPNLILKIEAELNAEGKHLDNGDCEHSFYFLQQDEEAWSDTSENLFGNRFFYKLGKKKHDIITHIQSHYLAPLERKMESPFLHNKYYQKFDHAMYK